MATGGKEIRTFMRTAHPGKHPKGKLEAPMITPARVARLIAVPRAAGLHRRPAESFSVCCRDLIEKIRAELFDETLIDGLHSGAERFHVRLV